MNKNKNMINWRMWCLSTTEGKKRNKKCWCGSGKKFKHCCLTKDYPHNNPDKLIDLMTSDKRLFAKMYMMDESDWIKYYSFWPTLIRRILNFSIKRLFRFWWYRFRNWLAIRKLRKIQKALKKQGK